MKRNFYAVFLFTITLISLNTQAQTNKCKTDEIYKKRAINNPSLQQQRDLNEIALQNWINENADAPKTRNIITIPVVVHVIYKTANQNVSDAQIHSQIAALNEDFRLFNADSLDDTHPFWTFTADAQIEFCLASVDPNGNATTGITRTLTTISAFTGEDGAEKYTSTGGHDNWNPSKYLNIWVCDLSAGAGLLGYATFPSDLATYPDDDGVVINYTAFGTMGTATNPNNNGRTGTHEIGHWLNLSHIWGDQACGDDLVADTEIAYESNFGCPGFPYNPNSSCGSGPNGEMYMNYMDYVDDACMVMFTAGQATRMRAALNGPRAGLLTSTACQSTSLTENNLTSSFSMYPNPGANEITLNLNNFSKEAITCSIYSILGEEIKTVSNIKTSTFTIPVNELPNGTYFVKIMQGTSSSMQKLFIAK